MPSLPSPAALTEAIRARAIAEGFDAVAFTRAALPLPVRKALRAFLAQGRHAAMGWMADTYDRRASPDALWPEAASAIVLGMSYAPEDPHPLDALSQRDRGYISVYARHRDYHDSVKKRLKRLARWLAESQDCAVKVFVDTAPLLEKPLAAQAGLGWQGKHSNLVSRRFGSWLFLGSVLTTLDLPPDPPATDHCGTCRRCLDACPTDAFDAPGRIDARRCVSYLTIEHPGPLPPALRARLGNRIYGCDDCLAVCPWNRFALPTPHAEFQPRPDLHSPSLAALARLDDSAFRALFSGSPIKRVGRDRFLRNVLTALGNSGEPTLAEAVRPHLADPAPVVRGAAVWALARLLPPPAFTAEAHAALPAEPDRQVREEWHLGLTRQEV